MKHGQISRNTAKAFFAFAALAIVGACSDNTMAPTAEAPAFVAPANFSRVGNTIVFRVNNAEGITKRLGKNLIEIPAGAICDLATSGYGTTYWDKPCTPMKGSVVITATIMEDGDGQPYIDFQPAMRFAPNKEVVLFLRQGTNSGRRELNVQYCNNAGYCIDESLTDPTLKPFRVGNTPVLGRRVKHFSGFSILLGEPCNGSVTDNGDGSYWCEQGGFSRRSGYMVASGEDVSDVLKDKDGAEVDKNKKGEQ